MISICIYITSPRFFVHLGYSLVTLFAEMLGDNHYRKSLFNMIHIQELLLGDIVRGSKIIITKKNLLCGLRASNSRVICFEFFTLLDFSIRETPYSFTSQFFGSLRSQLTSLLTLPPLNFLSHFVLDSFQS